MAMEQKDFDKQYGALVREDMREKYGRGKVRGGVDTWKYMSPMQREHAVLACAAYYVLRQISVSASKLTFEDAQMIIRAAIKAFPEEELGR